LSSYMLLKFNICLEWGYVLYGFFVLNGAKVFYHPLPKDILVKCFPLLDAAGALRMKLLEFACVHAVTCFRGHVRSLSLKFFPVRFGHIHI